MKLTVLSGLCFAFVISSLPALAQQASQLRPVGGKPLGSGEVISTARIADPNELVGINGRIVKMSDLASLFSSLDSLEAQHLHIQEMRIGEKTLPTVQLKGPSSKCSAQEQRDQAGSCQATGLKDQVPDSKPQPN